MLPEVLSNATSGMLPAETNDAVDGAANGVGVAQLQNDAIMAKKI
jgi:hypothetical protein